LKHKLKAWFQFGLVDDTGTGEMSYSGPDFLGKRGDPIHFSSFRSRGPSDRPKGSKATLIKMQVHFIRRHEIFEKLDAPRHGDLNIQTATDPYGHTPKEIVFIDAHGSLLFKG
jgi:hypothetical protein